VHSASSLKKTGVSLLSKDWKEGTDQFRRVAKNEGYHPISLNQSNEARKVRDGPSYERKAKGRWSITSEWENSFCGLD